MDNRNCLKITVSLVLIFISIGISFYDWENTNKYSIKIYFSKFSIQPKLTSIMIDILLFGGYIIRNTDELMEDNIKKCFCVTDFLFFWGNISMFTNEKIYVLFFSAQSILFVNVILMWLAARFLLRYILLSFVACSIFLLPKASEVYGFYGVIYIIFALLSFKIQADIGIFPEIKMKKNEYWNLDKNDEDNNYQLLYPNNISH